MTWDEIKAAVQAAKCQETPEQRAESAASWAYGQMALMKEYKDATPEELAKLKALCRRLVGCK